MAIEISLISNHILFAYKKTTMDVWASLAQVFKVQVITRLDRKQKTGTITARAPLPFLGSLSSAVVVDHRLTGQAEFPARTGRTWDTGRAASCQREAPTSGVPGAEHKHRLRALQLKSCEVG